MGILNTLHDGAFSNDDPLKDVYLKMRQDQAQEKPEEPADKSEEQEVLNEKTVDAKIQLDPVGKEDGDVDNDGDKDTSDKYLMKRRKAIQQAISKNKKQKKAVPEMKLSKEQDKIDTNPKLKEMSADLAYRAMDKADKKSRGNLSWMNPKKARKKAKQAQKFADYSIKKTLNKEEFDTVHEYTLEENARIDLKNFAQELKAYSAKRGGIDKNYFDNIANIASMGKMPGKEDIDNDTDPRDKVLDLMTKYIPLNVLKNLYKGLSPSFDHYLQSTTGVKTHVSQNLKRSVTVPEEVELDEVESDYAKEIEAFKAQGGKIKKLPPGKKFKSKFSKVKGPKKLPIQAEDAEIEENVAYLKNKEGHVFHISKRDKKGDAYSMHVADSSGKKVKDWGSHPSLSGAKKFANTRGFTEEVDFEEAYTMHKGMKIKNVPRSAGKDAVEYNKKRREAQRKRAGLDEAKKPNLTAGMECQECGKKFRAKLSTLQYGKTKCPKCKSTDLDFAFGAKNESIEPINEVRKSDYQLYHKDFSSAMQHAYAVAKKRGYTVDPQEIDSKVATGPRKPSSGKTNRYILGTDKKQNLHVQVANLDNKRYELNMYIESVQEEDMKSLKDLKEVESAYAKQIADYKARGGTVKKYIGPDMKKVKSATAGFKKKLAKTNKIVAQELEKVKAEKEANKQQDEAWKKGTYHVKDADGKIHGTYKSGKHASKAMHKLMDKGGHKELEVSRANEEVSKNVSKLNKVLENRKLEKSGAGEQGTDELARQYKKDTPGQIEEGNVEMQNNDAFRRMEGLVEYLMGLSIDDPGKFTIHPIPETNGYRIEYANGGLATVTEADWKNHFGNVSGEDFIELCKEFGMNVTTSGTPVIDTALDQIDGVTEDKEIDITKNTVTSTPETVAADYADRYKMENIVKLISKQVRGQ